MISTDTLSHGGLSWRTGIVASCTACDAGFEADSGLVMHDTPAQALTGASESGWQATETELLCPDCVHERTCARDGHDWTRWRQCRCNGSNPAHTEQVEHRICRRCLDVVEERRPAA